MEKEFKQGDLVNVKGNPSGIVYGREQDKIEVFIGDKTKKFDRNMVAHEEDSATISLEAEIELRKKYEAYLFSQIQKH